MKIAVAEATVLAAWELNQATPSFPTVVPSPDQSTSLPFLSTPTTLRPGVWDEQVKKFENMLTPPRAFPHKILIGSGVVLARLLHEATVTRLFTPLRLGELLKNRANASSGLVNQLAMKRSEDQVLGWKRRGETAELVPRQPQYDPRSSWTVVDALEAVKLAYTWSGYGSDLDADRLTDPFLKYVRQRPGELEGVKSLYEAVSWDVCLLMRSGVIFDEAVDDVMSRTHRQREYLDDFRQHSYKNRSLKVEDHESRGLPKGRGKDFGKRSQVDRARQPRRLRSPAPQKSSRSPQLHQAVVCLAHHRHLTVGSRLVTAKLVTRNRVQITNWVPAHFSALAP